MTKKKELTCEELQAVARRIDSGGFGELFTA